MMNNYPEVRLLEMFVQSLHFVALDYHLKASRGIYFKRSHNLFRTHLHIGYIWYYGFIGLPPFVHHREFTISYYILMYPSFNDMIASSETK